MVSKIPCKLYVLFVSLVIRRKGIVFIGPLQPGVYPFFGEFNPATAQGQVEVK